MTAASWAEARTLADLGELTALWLEGHLVHQPGYADPDPGETPGPDPETEPLVPVLAAANRAGYVTDGSQPGEDITGSNGVRYQQRAAVEGYADDATCAALREMARPHGFLFIATRAPRWRSSFRHAVPVTRAGCVNHTRFGTSLSRRFLADSWVGYGECHRDAVRALCGAWRVTIIDPQWGRTDSPLWPALAGFAGQKVSTP